MENIVIYLVLLGL